MILSTTKLYELLTVKLGKETAENLTTFIEHKIKDEVESKTQILATKGDLGLLKEDLTKEISRLEIKMEGTKSETIKWMFLFWIAQVAATVTLILLFIKK